MKTILGIDPGSRITGFGVIASNGREHSYITSGQIHIKGNSLANKLQVIYDGLNQVLGKYQPDEAAIEEVFMHQNPGAALKLGQARGAAIVVSANAAVPVAEYTARQVKQSVCGYGAATKHQMQHMVTQILQLSDIPPSDAADALGVALCHAHTQSGLVALTGGRYRKRRGRIR